MQKLILSLIFICSAFFSFGQQELPEAQKLQATAKIWGFLKYYHPTVAKGEFDWDKELINILPFVDEAKTKEDLSQVYLNWLKRLGKVEKTTIVEDDSVAVFEENFDLSWFYDETLFTVKLSDKLKFIEQNRLTTGHYYVGTHNYAGNIKIRNEQQYAGKKNAYPNQKYRLLNLFCYWNMVEYFFPYKYVTDQKWDDVLLEMIPKFKSAKNATQYHLTMLELVTKIDDSHAGGFMTNYLSKYFGAKSIPAKFKIVEDKVFITELLNEDLAKANDIRIGDVITKINDVTVLAAIKKLSPYIPASNWSVKKRNAQRKLFLGNAKSLKISYERDGTIKEKIIHRYTSKQIDTEQKSPKTKAENSGKWKILKGNIGYVNMGLVKIKDIGSMMFAMIECKAIIFDLRNYPNSVLYSLKAYLTGRDKAFVKFTKPLLSYPGKYQWFDNPTAPYSSTFSTFTNKTIVLINEETQSQAEFTSMGLQIAENSILIGSQTAGADGDVSYLEFMGGYKTWITGLGIYYPDGRETQRIGIVPDIEVKPTIKGLRAGRDEVLEKALEVANE